MKFEGIGGRFPGLCVAEGVMRGVTIRERSDDLEAFKPQVSAKVRSAYTLENVKDDPLFRAYRDFFWSVGVDPTKTRPASEALVRRILAGRPLPAINTAVDAYNLASVQHSVPVAAFDAATLRGGLTMRFATGGEEFLGIGMQEPLLLKPNQVVLCDEEKLIAVYPYRDSDGTKVAAATKDIHIVSCGVPGVGAEKVLDAYRACAEYLRRYCGAAPDEPVLSP
jgi:DNA/RNA-binding domain of Phe-tRNA-synthetase-like protein